MLCGPARAALLGIVGHIADSSSLCRIRTERPISMRTFAWNGMSRAACAMVSCQLATQGLDIPSALRPSGQFSVTWARSGVIPGDIPPTAPRAAVPTTVPTAISATAPTTAPAAGEAAGTAVGVAAGVVVEEAVPLVIGEAVPPTVPPAAPGVQLGVGLSLGSGAMCQWAAFASRNVLRLLFPVYRLQFAVYFAHRSPQPVLCSL